MLWQRAWDTKTPLTTTTDTRVEVLLCLRGRGGDTGSHAEEALLSSAGQPKQDRPFHLAQLPQSDEPRLCLRRTADMPPTPRPALPLLPLLLLLPHVPQGARAQVNPGKRDGDQAAARATRCVSLGCAPARASELGLMSPPPSPGLSWLWEQCVMAPRALPVWDSLLSCTWLSHCP